jgi:hypothetical protein
MGAKKGDAPQKAEHRPCNGLERIASPRSGRPAGALLDTAKECPCGATATRGKRYDVM